MVKNYPISCPCGNENSFKHLFSGKHKFRLPNQIKKTKLKFFIIQCPKCFLPMTYPRPYENSFQAEHYQDHKDVLDKIQRLETFKKYARHALKNIRIFKKTGRFLDIGCSIGVLVHEAQQKGFDAYGLEINRYAVIKAKELFDIKIFEENLFKNVSIESASFDVIALIQTLEHIEQPVLFLSRIKTLLKKDGILYISVPNFSGYMVKFKKTKWGGLDPAHHLWQFTPKSLENLLHLSGFSIQKMMHHQNMDHYGYELKRDFFAVRKIKEYLIRRSLKLNQGDHLMCIASALSG